MTRKNSADLQASSVHRELRSRILSLDLRPGARLVEEDLAANLEAGRTPVREALLRLQGEGFVVRDRGWVVQAVDSADVKAIFESRIAIEGFATRLAAERITDAELAEITALIAEMSPPNTPPRKKLNRMNQELHLKILQASRNPMLLQFHEKTQFHYWNMQDPIIFSNEQLDVSHVQHQQLLEALQAHDGDRAERLAREHVMQTMDIVCNALEE